jgi:hypothetical protein
MMDQLEFEQWSISAFSAFSFADKESFSISKTLGGAAAFDEPL